MDLRWQIQHSEKNWNREKVELLDRLDRDRQEWDRQKKELLRRIEQVRSCQVRISWGEQCLPERMRPLYHCYTQAKCSIKKQHRNDFASSATSMFLMLQNNLYTEGSKRKMLIIPIKEHLWEISSRLEVLSSFQLPWTSTVTFCLKALVHLCAETLNPQSYSRFGIQLLAVWKLFICELATKDAAAATIQSQVNSFSLAREHRGQHDKPWLITNAVISTKYSEEYWSREFCANFWYRLQILPIPLFSCLSVFSSA